MSDIVDNPGSVFHHGASYAVWGIRSHFMVHGDVRGFTFVDRFQNVQLVVVWSRHDENWQGVPPVGELVKAGRHLCQYGLNGVVVLPIDAAGLLAKALTVCHMGDKDNDAVVRELRLRLAS